MKKLIDTAKYILDKLTECGADCAQVSVAEGETEEFNVDAGEFSLIRSVSSTSASMKVIKDMKKGTISINQLQKDAIDEACAQCVDSAKAGAVDNALSIAALEENENFVQGVLAPDKEKFFDALIKFTEDIKREFPKIMIEQLIASYSYGKHALSNTNGVLFTEEDGAYNVSVMFSAHDGENTSSFNSFAVDFLDPSADIIDMADIRTIFERAEKELDAKPLNGKFLGTAVLAPACLGEFLSTAAGAFAGDFALIEGTSPWKNSLNEAVASENFTFSVIPNDKRIVCGEKITSDGYKSENFDIIKNGILKSFCLSEYAARKTGFERAKSTSSCVEVLPGEKTLDEIIAGIDNGILVCRFSGGEPAGNGDFSGVAKNSFLIKDGKISYSLSETMISGNLSQMLKNIREISKETVNDGCTILPYAAFDGVTVSGTSK